MNQAFRHETNERFNLKYLKNAHSPIQVATGDLYYIKDYPRVNHYLVKTNNSDKFKFGCITDKWLKWLIEGCYRTSMYYYGLFAYERYCYITIDTKDVKSNTTQRASGWHLDGLQGDEVPVKKGPDWQFIIYDCLPTLFTTQTFNSDGWNLSKDNIFKKLEEQIDISKIITYPPNTLLLMNAYYAHAAAKSDKQLSRKFIRINFTHCPVTSVKMTVNENIKYNYSIHVTNGIISKHLI